MIVCSSLRRSAVGAATALTVVVALGACATRPKDHSATIDRLMEGPGAAMPPIVRFVPVGDVQRGGIPVTRPAPYLIGPGDVLRVHFLGAQRLASLEGPLLTPVKEEGTVYIPIVGKVEARDKTTLDVEAAIVERVKAQINDPLVSVDVAEFHARRFRVVGEGVDQEQFLAANGKTTLLEALIRTGATRSLKADRDEAYLIRNKTVYPFSIAAMVDQADPAGDCVLQEGDHVFVPGLKERQDHVYVLGTVKQPGRFPMEHEGRMGRPGEMTLMGAVGMAGGFDEASAACNGVCIFRGGYRDLRVYRLSTQDVIKHGESIALAPGDRVHVGATDWARFNLALGLFTPTLGTITDALSIGLSAAAFSEASK